MQHKKINSLEPFDMLKDSEVKRWSKPGAPMKNPEHNTAQIKPSNYSIRPAKPTRSPTPTSLSTSASHHLLMMVAMISPS